MLAGKTMKGAAGLLVAALLWSAAAAAAEFALPDLDGRIHRLSQYQGRWVVVNYWATWCPPCLDEIPELVEFHEAHAPRVVVLGVNYEDTGLDHLRQFVDEYFISYPVLRGEPDGHTFAGRLLGLPTTYLVSPEGRVVDTRLGGITRRSLEDLLRRHGALPARQEARR